MKDINISSLSTKSGRLFTRNLFPYSQPFILFDVLTSKIQHRVKSSNAPAGGFPLTLRLPVYTGKLISWNTTNKISDLTTVESFDSESTRISLLLLIKFAACLNKRRPVDKVMINFLLRFPFLTQKITFVDNFCSLFKWRRPVFSPYRLLGLLSILAWRQ